jgi:aryl-alcohol dehydrogenase-like predicted oxidoreductase
VTHRVDTADMYGPHTNELLVGKALAGRRDEAAPATIFGHAAGRNVAPIPGTSRRSYLEENVAALEVELTEEVLGSLGSVTPAQGDRYADMSPLDRSAIPSHVVAAAFPGWRPFTWA